MLQVLYSFSIVIPKFDPLTACGKKRGNTNLCHGELQLVKNNKDEFVYACKECGNLRNVCGTIENEVKCNGALTESEKQWICFKCNTAKDKE